MQEQVKTHPLFHFRKPPTGSLGHPRLRLKAALPAVVLFLMSWVSVLPVQAQLYQSKASGNWSDATTWYFVNYNTGQFILDAVPTTGVPTYVYGATVTLTGTGEYGDLTVVSSGTLNINANSDMNGILGIQNDGVINIGGNATVRNNLTNNATLNWNDGSITGNSPAGTTFTNTPTGTMNFNSLGTNPLLALISFVNRGQITRNGSGVQTISTSFTNEATGTVTVAAGKSLTFSGTTTNNGSMINNGTLTNAGLMKGTGSFSGNIITTSTGTLSPGLSPGCMTFANDYTHQGTLAVEVNGTTACTTYDRITVTGNASLSGTLAASISNSFSFTSGNIITFIDAGSISGTFSQISPALPTGWNVRYNYPNAGEVSLEFTALNAVCQNVNLTLDGSGNATLLASQVDNGSTAAAGIQSISVSPNTFTCSNLGTNTVTLTVTDVNGATATCTATVTVTDGTLPTVVCQNITLQLGANGQATITPQDVDGGSSDNCGITSLTLNRNTFTCADITVAPTVATDLIFSEYLEGSSNNKYIEIFNGTGAPVNLANYALRLYANGSTTVTTTTALTGTLANGATVVYKNSLSTIYSGTNTTAPAVNFNGDDAMELFKVSTSQRVDLIGRIGEDPGTAWVAGAITTLDKTLRRKPTVIQGVTSNPASGFPTLATEWDQFSIDVVSGLGNHTFTPPAGYLAQVTLTATDLSGNTASCQAAVTVVDLLPPAVVCQDVTIYLNANGTATLSAAQVDNGTADNCSATSLQISKTAFTCADLGTTQVTLTATDAKGNTSNCQANVTVADTISPTAVCKDASVTLDLTGAAILLASEVNNGSTDNCGIASVTVSPNTFTLADVGLKTVTLTVTDASGNQRTCTSTLTVIGSVNTDPVAVCSNVTLSLDVNGQATLQPIQVGSLSTVFFGTPTLSLNQTIFDCSMIGLNTVELTVTDANGDFATCLADVQVEDNLAPVAICQNVTLQLDANGQATLSASDVDNGSFDNCANVSLSLDRTAFTCADIADGVLPASDLIISEYVEGSASNKYIEIYNGTGASVNLANYSLRLYANGAASPTTSNTLSGSLANGSTVVYQNSSATIYAGTATNATAVNYNGDDAVELFNLTTNQRVDLFGRIGEDPGTAWTAAGGYSTLDKTLRRKPSVYQGTTTNPASGFPTLATEWDVFNIDVVSNLGSHTFTPPPVPSPVVTLTVTDNSGNTATCTAIVTVLDSIAPATPTLADATGECSVTVTPPTTTDNCAGTVTGTTNDPLTYSAQGSYIVHWTFDDGNGNTISVNQNVVVDDVTPPTTPTLADATGECSVTVTAPTTTDNCAGTVTGTTSDSLTYSAQGNYTINWTFDDGNGNSTTATQLVVVDDVTPPATPTLADATGECSVTVTAPTTTDNCAGTVTGTTSDSLAYSAQGSYILNWTFDDGNGNTTSATQSVVVEDVTAPTAICQNVNVQLDGNGNASITAAQVDNGSFDNCGIASVTVSPSTFTAANLGANTVTLTVTDVNGLQSTCTATVTVNAYDAPNAICKNVTVAVDANGNASVTAAQVDNGSTAAAGIQSISVSPNTFTCANLGVNNVILTVTDNNGVSSTCTAKVTVEDNIAPDTLTLADATGECSVTVTPPTTTDNCAGIVTGTTSDSLTYTAQGSYTINWTFDDGNGNTTFATQNVVVDDVTPPATPTLADATGECSVTVTPPTTTDNCAGTVTGTTSDPLSYSGQGSYTIHWTFNDGNGNTTSANQQVVVNDVTAPTAICQNVTVPLNGTGNASITAAQVNNGSFDNCGIATVTVSPNTFTAANLGANTVTLTVTDVNGLISTCTATVNVTGTAPCSTIAVTKFYVVKVGTNQDLFELVNGGFISKTVGTINIRAEVQECGQVIESVKFQLTGTAPLNKIENVAPWALAGDNNGVFQVWSAPVGSYTLRGTPYSLDNAAGTAGTALQVSFQVVNTFPAPTVTVNTTPVSCNGGSNGTATVNISGGTAPYTISWSTGQTAITSLSGLSAGNYSVTVTDANNVVKTTPFSIAQPAVLNAVATSTPASSANTANGSISLAISGGTTPYTISWNTGAQGNPLSNLLPGIYTATILDANGCQRTVSGTVNVAPACVNSFVETFYVVQPNGTQDLFELTNGGVISKTLGNVSIRAEVNACGQVVESVRLNLSGAATINRTENVAPWALNGDNNGVFTPWNAAIGSYTLTARPYSLDNAGGVAGTAKTITFQVVSGTLARQPGIQEPTVAGLSIELYPNPATESVTLRLEGPANEQVEALVFDSWGKKVFTFSWQKDQTTVEKVIDLRELAEGMYFIQIRQGDYQTVERLLKMN